MNTTGKPRDFQKDAVEAAIKIALLFTLVIWTIFIIKPFLIPVLWGIIIAVAMEPFIGWVTGIMGGRRKLAAILFALVVIAALILPAAMLISSSIDVIHSLSEGIDNKTLSVPAPPAGVEGWAVIGPTVYKYWSLASSNLAAALTKFGPHLKTLMGNLAGSVGGGLAAIFMFIISVIIAAALLATADKGAVAITRIITRFAGDKGGEITSLATATIRGVMQGVVGVAVIQSVLSAIGMVIVGVPLAGLWAVIVLVCAVIQLPPILVLGPIAAWVFSVADTMPAVFFLIWALVVSASDGVLKPILMGRGVDIPMLVILIGALGGMMLSGIIGLFVGAVVVAISYTLFMAWIEEEQGQAGENETDV